MSKIQEIKLFFESKYGLAKYFAILLAITYVIVGFAYNAGFETITISMAMMFFAIATVFLLIQTFVAAVKHCLCGLNSINSMTFAISLIGILTAFYARDFASVLMLVWPILFAVPASYIITTYFAIWTNPKRNAIC
ncbi:MAG: hypothetical protein WC788_01735 [Candidatus Paceibacterota bacterium]|jgi:hypothetical protein